MKVLSRYIVFEVLKGALITQIILLTLFNLFTFTDELKHLGEGRYGINEILYYLLLTSPGVFYELLPASALLGSLFVLGSMGNNRELIAMRAAGLSVFGIIKAVMLAGCFLVGITLIVGEFIAPSCQRAAHLLRVSAQAGRTITSSEQGVWFREGKTFINIKKVVGDGDLADLVIYELDENGHLHKTTHVDQALFLGNQEWKLNNVVSSEISTEQMTTFNIDDQLWKSSIAPNLLKIVTVLPNNLSMVDLAGYISFLKTNHQKSHVYELAFWGRVVNPLVTFIMLLLATPFVISIKRGVSVGERMMIGVVIGMGFNILDKIVGHLGLIYGLNPALIAFVPSFVVLLLALFFLKNTQA